MGINNNILSLESTEEKLDVEIKNEKTKIEKKLLKIKQQIEIEIDNLRNESENIETINLHESIEKLIQDKNIKEDIIKKYNEKVNELEIYVEKIKHENSILENKFSETYQNSIVEYTNNLDNELDKIVKEINVFYSIDKINLRVLNFNNEIGYINRYLEIQKINKEESDELNLINKDKIRESKINEIKNSYNEQIFELENDIKDKEKNISEIQQNSIDNNLTKELEDISEEKMMNDVSILNLISLKDEKEEKLNEIKTNYNEKKKI